jgi:hypothetical protein
VLLGVALLLVVIFVIVPLLFVRVLPLIRDSWKAMVKRARGIAAAALLVQFLHLAYWGVWLILVGLFPGWLLASGEAGDHYDALALSVGFFLFGAALLAIGLSPIPMSKAPKPVRVIWYQFIGAGAAAVGLVFMNGYASVVWKGPESLNTAAQDLLVAFVALLTCLACGQYLVLYEGFGKSVAGNDRAGGLSVPAVASEGVPAVASEGVPAVASEGVPAVARDWRPLAPPTRPQPRFGQRRG